MTEQANVETEQETEQETETTQLQITAHDPNDVNIKDFKFKAKKDMKGKFRRAERILTIDDPDSPDDPIHFHVRALTPAEEASLHQKLLSDEDMRGLVSTFMEKAEDGEKIETEDVTELIAAKLNGGQTDVTSDRYLRKVQMGIMKPSGLSLQWLADLNPVILELLHDTIDELRFLQEQWIINTSPAIRKVSEE